MFSRITRTAAAATFGLALLGAASASNATIYNISATNSGIDITLAAGAYTISWVGVAGGGLYDAWNGNCVSGNCNTGWVENFSAIELPIDPSGNFTVDLFGLGPQQSSALGALQAIQAAANINHGHIDFVGGVGGAFQPDGPIPQPWIVNTGGGSIHLGAGDGTPENNFGGVSLSIVAVPEPSTWAMLITGFGFAGAALRRRRIRTVA